FDDGTGWCHPDHALQRALAWDEARQWVEENGIRLATVDPASPTDDLHSLDRWLTEPRVIGVGESTHGTRDFFQMKHRLLRHLVEKHGFRLFGIEASYAACLPINEYIQGGNIDPGVAIKGQGFWTWDTEEVLALVEWMRKWNETRPASDTPLVFYGFDTQDAYTPLKLVLEELRKSDHKTAATFEDRLEIALEKQYGKSLSEATTNQLDGLLQTIEDLRNYCDTRKNFTTEQQRSTALLIEQAYSAIQMNRARLDQWSSLGMLKEVALYNRIREKIDALNPWTSRLKGEQSELLREFLTAATDLRQCQLRFRDKLKPSERAAWASSVEWAISLSDSGSYREVLVDLQQFLKVCSEYVDKPRELTNVRDETMAQFVEKILEQHGKEARIMLWAHDWHISKLDSDPTQNVPRMGTYLERTFGKDYLPIGLSFGAGSFQSRYYPSNDEDPARRVLTKFDLDGSRYDSFSYMFDNFDAPVSAFAVSRLANSELPQWFRSKHANRTIGAVFQPKLADSDSYYEEIVLGEHFEVVIHVRKTQRARPLSPQPRFNLGVRWREDDDQSGTRPGAIVDSVNQGSLAESAGLKTGDQVVKFDSLPIKDAADMKAALATIERPGSVQLKLIRSQAVGAQDNNSRELTLFIIVPSWIVE
ncbi:MAG: erythromycin esterase family protein, partial [Planctomycetota bacterium]